jgi:hypothetical protein
LVLIGDYESATWGKALYFFDTTTGSQLRTVPVSDWIGGLACVAPANGS